MWGFTRGWIRGWNMEDKKCVHFFFGGHGVRIPTWLADNTELCGNGLRCVVWGWGSLLESGVLVMLTSQCLDTNNVCKQQAIAFCLSLHVGESCCVIIGWAAAAFHVDLHSTFLCWFQGCHVWRKFLACVRRLSCFLDLILTKFWSLDMSCRMNHEQR